VLVEAPIAPTAQAAREIGELDAVVAANPLRYGLHSRRLLEELHPVEDPLETFFAAWRVRAGSGTHTLLPLLLDYVREICPERVERVSAMGRVDLSVMTVTLRYASGVLGSLEVGEHLPREFPSEMELVVECFCRETILHCLPGRQAVEVAGRTSTRTDWQPDAYGGVVNAFAEWLNGGPRPHGSIQRDVEALRLADSILQAAHAGNVRVLGD
jgi:predicted dehydrogenase